MLIKDQKMTDTFIAERILKKCKKIGDNYETDDEDSRSDDHALYVKWLHYPLMESTFEPLKEFEKSDAANILIPQYFVEKNERAVYGFYLLKSGDASFYYPAFVKNINEGNRQLFIYNYCYHSYEIINDKRF